ncbi:MAG: hypothetical protein AB1578_15705 [Thermodesulfobacteriota bacterium]
MKMMPAGRADVFDAAGNLLESFEHGPEPLITVDGLGAYLGGDVGPEGRALENALRGSDALTAAKEAASLTDAVHRAKGLAAQGEHGTKSRGKQKRSRAWTAVVARHLHEAHPGPTDEAAFRQAKSWTKPVKIEGEEEVFRVYWHEPANALQCEGRRGQLGFSGFREKRRVYRKEMSAASP